MSEHPNPGAALSTAFATLLVVVGCSAPKGGSDARSTASDSAESPARPAPEGLLPWTDAFQKSAALLAADVRIEGPVGLIAHIATVSNPEELERSEKAVPEGFLQVITIRPEAPGAQIKAQLDRLTIVALQRLSVLEQPWATEVVVQAKGDVFYAERESQQEKHVESLRLAGKIAR